MATTIIIMQGRQKGKAKERPKDRTALSNQKQSEYACLMFVCFLVCSYNTPWKHDEFLGPTNNKKRANWSTTHVSVLASKTQLKGLMNDSHFNNNWPVGSFYQCLILGFPLPPLPPPKQFSDIYNLVIFFFSKNEKN